MPRVTLAHLWFVTFPPFEDGNGRLARAITDMALAQDERQPMRLFSLSAQILREREHYYTILDQTQRGSLEVEVTAWLRWFLVQVEAAAGAAEQTVANTLATRDGEERAERVRPSHDGDRLRVTRRQGRRHAHAPYRSGAGRDQLSEPEHGSRAPRESFTSRAVLTER